MIKYNAKYYTKYKLQIEDGCKDRYIDIILANWHQIQIKTDIIRKTKLLTKMKVVIYAGASRGAQNDGGFDELYLIHS